MTTSRGSTWALRALTGLLLALLWTPAVPGRVILQYFESRWETIERRMPDVFMTGYGAVWLPPPSVADTGGFSVGYDVYDRFNLGRPNWQSLYGTEDQLRRLVSEGDRANVLTFTDMVLNHNGFSDASRPGFVEGGDYPGFITTLPEDIDGDFHSAFAGGDLNSRLSGLIDIAQEKNHRFIRHPVEEGHPDNIPFETPRESNRRFYPDLDPAPGDVLTPSGFNLTNPLGGDPVIENANDLLARHCQWMIEVIGIDGYRLDAVKHVPQWFWTDIYDPAVFGIGPGGSTPFSFGEVLDADFGVLSSYTRKDGFGNRDALDFPLFFTMRDVLSANGFGDMSRLEFASFDGSDGNANDGTRGVQFVASHDDGAPSADNLAHAHILTRTGFPIVYFNAHEFGTGRDFPLSGRGDALGGEFGETITSLVGIHNVHAREAHITRHVDGDVYLYERDRAMVVGLNDNQVFDGDRNIQTSFQAGTVLVELTGNPRASDPVIVGGDGRATFTIPHNGESLGYAVWAPRVPRGSLTVTPFAISPVAFVFPPDGEEVPSGVRRVTPIEVITADTATLTLTLEDDDLDDNAIVRVDNGIDLTGNGLFGGGEFAGFQEFTSADPGVSGAGLYSSTLDLTGLGEGTHYLEAIAFLQRPAGNPALFRSFRKVIHLDREPPEVDLRFPTRTGSGDVQSRQFEVVVDSIDTTANSVHVFADFMGTDGDAIAAVGAASQATRVDRGEFRWNWSDIDPGTHELTVVAFEETGNVSVTRFGGIDAEVPIPEVRFQNLPGVIASASFDQIFVQVNFQHPFGGSNLVFDPLGQAANSFDVSLLIDGEEFPAFAFDEDLVGSENTLHQQENDFGDDFDNFRFNWRGYDRGFHEFEIRATAILDGAAQPASSVMQTVEVPSTVAGPGFVIVDPPPRADPGDPPTRLLLDPGSLSVTVASLESSARSIAVFLQSGESEGLVAMQTLTGEEGTLTVTGALASRDLVNGAANVRVQVSTSPLLGEGIFETRSTQVLILEAQDFIPPSGEPIPDGQDNDWAEIPGGMDIHSVFTQGGEWIYIGDGGDARTDVGTDAVDITELRLTQSSENLHGLVRFAEISDVRLASFAIAFDVPALSGSIGFIGDESNTELDLSQGNTWDFTAQVHFVNDSFSQVELFDAAGDPVWFAPEGEASFISAENDLLEFTLPRSALGLDGDEATTIAIQAATFQNALFDGAGGFNNVVDSTTDVFMVDALDVVGGEVGVAENAYGRATFADTPVIENPNGAVTLIHEITIPAPADSGSAPPPSVLGVDPGDGSVFTSADPVSVEIATNDAASSVLLALEGQIVSASLASQSGGERRWMATTPALSALSSEVIVAAFGNSNFTGRSGLLRLTYLLDLPAPSAAAIAAHLIGRTPLAGDQLIAADLNSDGGVDILDVVLRVNASSP